MADSKGVEESFDSGGPSVPFVPIDPVAASEDELIDQLGTLFPDILGDSCPGGAPIAPPGGDIYPPREKYVESLVHNIRQGGPELSTENCLELLVRPESTKFVKEYGTPSGITPLPSLPPKSLVTPKNPLCHYLSLLCPLIEPLLTV